MNAERPAEAALTAGVLRALLPVERIELWFVVALCAVAAVRAPGELPGLFAAAGAIVAVRAVAGRGRLAGIVADFFPIAIGIYLLNAAGALIAAGHPESWDPTFAAVDQRAFGELLRHWRFALGRPAWLTDVASLLYMVYYALPVAAAGTLYASGRRADFEALALAVMATLLTSYACYFVWPTTGPRVPAALEQQVLGGGSLSVAVRAFLHWAERNDFDAFPSGHTAVTLAMLGAAWRPLPRWRVLLVCCAVGILFATVYLSLHYVIDVVAGVGLAVLVHGALWLRRRAASRPPPWGAAGPSPKQA